MRYSASPPADEVVQPSTRPPFDLAALIAIAWRERLAVIATTVIAAALMVLYLNVAKYSYTATLKVTAAQSTSADGLLSRLGNLGGLAGLTAGRLGGAGGSAPFLNYSENLQSRTAAERLARDRDLLRAMFPAEWDAARNRWQEPRGGYGGLVNAVKRALGLPIYAWRPPDAARVQDFLERNVGVGQDQRKPIVTVTYSAVDPVHAVRLLERLHAVVDDDIRRRALVRAESNIEFLTQQLRVVTLADHRVALAEALSEQEKTRMLARSSAPFAAEPLSAASASLRPTSPRPLLFLVGSIIAGLGLGVLAAIALDQFREARRWRRARRLAAQDAPGERLASV